MCYSIPGRVVDAAAQTAVVDYFGERRTVRYEALSLRPGDYVYAQGGYVIEQIPPAAAREILNLWKETFFALQETDVRLSCRQAEAEGLKPQAARLLDQALEGRIRSPQHLLRLVRLGRGPDGRLLLQAANFLRQKHFGNSCCVHGIIEFSNHCRETCRYCGISRHNVRLPRMRMRAEDIVAAAVAAVAQHGFKALVLQSGEDAYYSVADLCAVVEAIKKRAAVLLFISFGETGLEGLEKLYRAGARGLLMRFETGNPRLYARLHPGACLHSRLAHLRHARRLGFTIITGGLIGLPGQTDADCVQDIFLAQRLQADMYSFGPFLPHPQTPLANAPLPEAGRILALLAAIRILDPRHANILITTGLETLDPAAREQGLMAGANSLMLNLTPEAYRKNYALYPNRAHSQETVRQQISDTLDLLHRLGRAPTDLGSRRDS